jgi:hypothetical protein
MELQTNELGAVSPVLQTPIGQEDLVVLKTQPQLLTGGVAPCI